MKNKSDKHILDIVPLSRIPLTRNQSFSYLSEKKLSVGTLVSIPLFRRSIEGIVLGSRKDFSRLGNIELKKIEKIIAKKFLTQSQIKLAKFISDYYLSPLGVIMKNFTPKRVKARKIKPKSQKPEQKKIILTTEQENAVKKITGNRKYLLFGPAGSGKTEVYIHSILRLIKRDPKLQFLVLIPEKTLLVQAQQRYAPYFKEKEIATLSSQLSKGEIFSSWEKIRSGKARLILGTRMAIFAPFSKLGLVVIDEEQDISYKQWDMNPHYDARIVAEELAKLHRCPLVRGSATPSVESYYRAQKQKIILLNLPNLQKQTPNSAIANSPFKKSKPSLIEIVDMKRERWSKNYTCISKKLKSEIEYALKYKKQIILLINRQGMSAFSVCNSCRTVLKCPKCDRALVYDSDGTYKCAHCAYCSDITPKCAKCGELNFKNIGLGTQKVAREISQLFPKAKLSLADSKIAIGKDFLKKIYTDFSLGKTDILIGTQMISKGWDLPNVVLTGIIDADNMLNFPDFSSQERAFQNIVQLAGRVNRPGSAYPGNTVIQTFYPENPTLQLASTRDYLSFWKKEIADRKALSLPPFSQMIKLTFQNYDREKVEKEACFLYNLLSKIPALSPTEPFYPLLSKIRGRYRKQIIIKIKSSTKNKHVREALKKIKSGWTVDVDPISIS